MNFRSPAERLAQLNEAMSQIVPAAQAVAAGMPLELDKLIETHANYRDLPELREWFLGALPEYQQSKEAANARIRDPNNGTQTRINRSERTNAGQTVQALTQFQGDDGGATGPLIE